MHQLKVSDGRWWAAAHHCPSLAICSWTLFYIAQITNIERNLAISCKILLIFGETLQNILKYTLLHCEFYWNHIKNQRLYPLFRKDHWWAVMGSCPSLSITGPLSIHFFKTHKSHFFIEIGQNLAKHSWYLWKHGKINWKIGYSTVNLNQIR